MALTFETVDQVFRAVPGPLPDSQKAIVKLLEDRFVEMAKTIISNVPNCADRSAALRDLRTAKMMCIEAVVKGGLV